MGVLDLERIFFLPSFIGLAHIFTLYYVILTTWIEYYGHENLKGIDARPQEW